MIFMSSYSFNDDIISVGINVYEFNNGMHFTYADDGKIFSLSNSLAKVEYNYTTDRLGSGYSITLANGRTFTRNTIHDDYRRGLLMNISSALNGLQLDYYSYAYDALNRTITRNGDRFGYNERSEVVEASISGNAAKYGYDEIDNSTNWNANSLNQYSQLQHDLDGNLLADGNLAFTYDSYNRLKTVSSNGVLLVTNFYDAKSRRVRKVTPAAVTTFFYDGWNLIEERVAGTNGTVSIFRYYWGKDVSGELQGAGGVGGLLYLTHDDEIYIPLYDGGGNVTKYIDASGNIVASYTYGAFGQLLSKSGPLADVFRFRFSTKYYDAETGLYYYGYRFYNPDHMRWLNRDPVGENGGVNLYGFCENNPMKKWDYLGMHWEFSTPRWNAEQGFLDFSVRYIMPPSERKCCHAVTVDRYVKKIFGIGNRFGSYEIDHGGDGGMTDFAKPYIGYAEDDSPDGQNFYVYRLPWTQSFKWQARCTKGPNAGKILSTVERQFKTSGHWLWNPKREGTFLW